MRIGVKAILSGVIVAGALAAPAEAALLITVDKDAQQMTVDVDGQTRYVWPVSTGVAGYDTPNGSYKPFRMEPSHFSKEFDNAPMPHAIFFSQIGHAIHGTNQTRHLGRAASHGCVRLSPRNAATLYTLVQSQKMANSRVVIEGRTAAPMVERDDFRGRTVPVRQRVRDEDGTVRPVRVTRRPPSSDPYYQSTTNSGYDDPFDRRDPYAGPRRTGVFDGGQGW